MIVASRSPAPIAATWWYSLQPDREGKGQTTGDRAALARLRRADLHSAMPIRQRFSQLGYRPPADLSRVAVTAAVLAAVRDDDPEIHPARPLGFDLHDRSPRPRRSPLRFRRLIRAADDEEHLTVSPRGASGRWAAQCARPGKGAAFLERGRAARVDLATTPPMPRRQPASSLRQPERSGTPQHEPLSPAPLPHLLSARQPQSG